MAIRQYVTISICFSFIHRKPFIALFIFNDEKERAKWWRIAFGEFYGNSTDFFGMALLPWQKRPDKIATEEKNVQLREMNWAEDREKNTSNVANKKKKLN